MNQHEWVQTCTKKYKEQGLTPGDPGDGNWERAHYPTPECEGGKECIWLLHNDHQVQGVLQSEEYQSICFFSPHVLRFLQTGVFVSEWFYVYDLYQKWSQANGSRLGKVYGTRNAKAMNDHPNTKKSRDETNKRLSKKVLCVETGCIYPSTLEASKQTGVWQGGISRSCRKGCRAGGYYWKFTE
jgi:hypothetical protein